MNVQLLQTIIISGLPLSGKTRLLDWLAGQKPFSEYLRLSVDEIRLGLFGERKLSWSEHMLKNEVAWLRIKTVHLIEKRSVLHEVPMLNSSDYYEPVLRMVDDTNRYSLAIYNEKSKEMEGIPLYMTSLKVVHLFCGADIATERAERRRIEISRYGNQSGTDVFDWKTRRVGIMKMEFPTIFNPLYVDTSDETAQCVELYQRDILGYLLGNLKGVIGVEFEERLKRAKEAHAKLKELVS